MNTSKSAARLSGFSIITMALIAGLIMPLIFTPLFESDEAIFSSALVELENTFLIGTLGWVVILICDIAASWGLYAFYKRKDKRKAAIMGGLRLLYSIILAVAISFLFLGYAELLQEKTRPVNVKENLILFQSIWQFGLIIFGFHLLYLAPLVCQKGRGIKLMSALLFISGIGYIGSNVASFFIIDYHEIRATVEAFFIIPMVFGELSLAIWLLLKGGKTSLSGSHNPLPDAA